MTWGTSEFIDAEKNRVPHTSEASCHPKAFADAYRPLRDFFDHLETICDVDLNETKMACHTIKAETRDEQRDLWGD